EERRCRAVAIDFVDLPVGRGSDIERAVGRDSQRMNLKLGGVEEHRPLAVRPDAVDLTLVTGTEEESAVGGSRNRPDERRRGLVDEVDGGAEHELATRID